MKAANSEPLVVDASVSLAWMMPDEDALGTQAILDTVVASGAYVPSIWPLEVANALLVAMRRGRLTAPQRQTALAALADLPIRVDETVPLLAWTTLSEIAEDLQLTVYDAAYLELALRKAMPLATLDKALRRAATSAGARLFAIEL
jgi:predicted nucleic acid-binding protein